VAIRLGLESQGIPIFAGHLCARSEKAIGTVDWTPRTMPIGALLDVTVQIFRAGDSLEPRDSLRQSSVVVPRISPG